MKTTNLLVAAFVAGSVMFASCGNKQAQKNVETDQVEVAAAMEVDDLLANADSLVGQEVTFEGVCTHACKHGATKIFVMGSDDTKVIRVQAGELGAFDTKCVKNLVSIKGILHEERIDEAYLQRWEAQVAAQTAKEHGEEGEGGCSSEKAARGETGNTPAERIADFRTKIAERQAACGKAYISTYFVEAKSYEIK